MDLEDWLPRTLKSGFPGVPIIALTATATPHVQKDICQVSLQLCNFAFMQNKIQGGKKKRKEIEVII